MMALFHWETFLAQASQAYKIFGKMNKQDVYKQGMGSMEERLVRLYNQYRHSVGDKEMDEKATIPVWLTNAGLESRDTRLMYLETSEIIIDLAAHAQLFQDPQTLREKIQRGEL